MGHNVDLYLHSAADNFCYYPPWPLGTVVFPKPGVWLKAFFSHNGSENGHILCLCTTKGVIWTSCSDSILSCEHLVEAYEKELMNEYRNPLCLCFQGL